MLTDKYSRIHNCLRIPLTENCNLRRTIFGEPLGRKDAADIMRRLSRLPVSLAMPTNGTRIPEFMPVLEEARIKR